MTDEITRNVIAADLFAELSEQAQAEAIYESDNFHLVLTNVIAAYTMKPDDLAELGKAVLTCIDDYLEPQIDEELASFEPRDYEHDAAHANTIINRENASAINLADRSSLNTLL